MVNGTTLIIKSQVFNRSMKSFPPMSNKKKHQSVEIKVYQDHITSFPLSFAFLYREEKEILLNGR